MSALPSLPLFTDAYIADTAHLTNEEHGAYLRLLMFAWRSADCRLPDDDARLARMLGLSAGKWAKIKTAVMAFWTLCDGFWTQKRLSKEHQFVTKKVEQKRANGRQGGRPKSLENNEAAKANGSENKTEPKAPTPTPIKTPIAPKGAEPEGFADFWSAYPKRNGDNPRKTALRAYTGAIRRGATHAAIMTGLRRYVGKMTEAGKIGTEFVAQAATWLNQDRFEAPLEDGKRSATVANVLSTFSDDRWRGEVRNWRSRGGHWPLRQMTPPPDERGTLVPPQILSEFGIEAARPAQPNLFVASAA